MVFIFCVIERIWYLRCLSYKSDIYASSSDSHRCPTFIYIYSDEVQKENKGNDGCKKESFFADFIIVQVHKKN